MYLYYFLAGVIALTFLITLIANRYLGVDLWKLIVFTPAAVVLGVFCAKLMRLIEEGTWTGFSFYGAVFFEPVLMILVGSLIKMKPADVMDLGAVTGCVTLVVLKLQCKITGCCEGRILRYLENGRPVRFPSQIAEMICGCVLLIIIMLIIRSGKQRGYVYAWFLLLYGVFRFFLNLLRDTTPFVLGLSAGCFWSILSVMIGGTVLILKSRKRSSTPTGKVLPKKK